MSLFTKRKFQSLTLTQQHHHCSLLLRRLYENFSEKEFREYTQWREWMGLAACEAHYKCIADEYHFHLKAAGKHARELPPIQTGDRKVPLQPMLPIAIVLDNLRSAHNVGSIIRTTEAFSLGNIYCLGTTPTSDHKQVQETSMGAYQWVSCKKIETLESLPKPFVVLETSPEATLLSQFIFPSKFTLVVGNEEYGCSDKTLEIADYMITIPLVGRKNSLNVANAFAILAAQLRDLCMIKPQSPPNGIRSRYLGNNRRAAANAEEAQRDWNTNGANSEQ